MPITNYSVLQGLPTAGKVDTGASTHYQITMQATGGPFTVAVNIESTDGSEVLYAIVENFQPPDPAGLLALSSGMHALNSIPGGLALDFVREQVNSKPIITVTEMTLFPESDKLGGHAASRAPLGYTLTQTSPMWTELINTSCRCFIPVVGTVILTPPDSSPGKRAKLLGRHLDSWLIEVCCFGVDQ